MRRRFVLNMERIHGLVKLIFSDVDALQPTGIFRSEGPRADILRTIVVFLHATFEDMLRSSAPQGKRNWNFYSREDIEKVLKRGGLDAAPFRRLFPTVCQMAKRRKRIVHEADLSKKTDAAPAAWTHVDNWQLIMWLLAVPAFYWLLCLSLNPNDQVAKQRHGRLMKAIDRHAGFGRELVAFSKKMPLEPTEMLDGLQKLMESLKSVSAFLDGPALNA
jgi:hypothetical protein